MMKDLNDTDMEMKVDDSAVRRYLKEAMFKALFCNKANIARMYAEATSSETVSERDIELANLVQIRGDDLHNSLAFTVRNKVLCLVEIPSRDDDNMIFRSVIDVPCRFIDLILSGRLPRDEVLSLQMKVFVVHPASDDRWPTGEMQKFKYLPLKFSDESALVHVDLPEEGILREYMDFCNVVNAKITDGHGESAILNVFYECISKRILAHFIATYDSEIMDLYIRIRGAERRYVLDMEDSREEGVNIGEKRARIEIASFLLSRGDSTESVAEATGLCPDEVVALQSDK